MRKTSTSLFLTRGVVIAGISLVVLLLSSFPGCLPTTPTNFAVQASGAYSTAITITGDDIGISSWTISRALTSDGEYSELYSGAYNGDGYEDDGLEPDTEYFYKVSIVFDPGSDAVELNSGNPRSATTSAGLEAPTGVEAEYVGGEGGAYDVIVTWEAVGAATSYTVYFSTSYETNDAFYEDDSNFTDVESVTSGTSLTIKSSDVTFADSTRYYFYVTASNSVEGESEYSRTEAYFDTPGAPQAPTDVEVSIVEASDSLRLSWSAVGFADGYWVYRATSSGGPYSKLGEAATGETEYTDTSVDTSSTYYYKVVSVSETYGPNDNTDIVQNYLDDIAYVLGSTAIDAPTGVQGQSDETDGTMDLTWTGVAGADTYRVYRSNYATYGYEAIHTTSSNTTSYSDNNNLKHGLTYYYRVTAIAAAGAESAFSETLVVTVSFLLDPPTGLNATALADTAITVSWVAPTSYLDADDIRYDVYRFDGAEYVVTNAVNRTGNSAIVTSLVAGTTYQFKVLAKESGDDGTLESELSATVSAQTLPATPTVSTKEVSSTSITLEFDQPSGAKGVKIYRSTSAEDGYQPLNSGNVVTATEFEDTGRSVGTTYYYKVTAVTDETPQRETSLAYVDPHEATTYALSQPSIISASKNDSNIEVNWGPISGATGYTVEYDINNSGTWTEVTRADDSATSESFSPSGVVIGDAVYVRIQAFNDGDGISSYSDASEVEWY